MKKVLWISRHALTEEQVNDLKNIYGEISIDMINKTIKDIGEIKDNIDHSDIIAAVLPMEKMQELKEAAGSKPVIRAESARIPLDSFVKNANGVMEQQYAFKHRYWEEIQQINIVSKRLS